MDWWPNVEGWFLCVVSLHRSVAEGWPKCSCKPWGGSGSEVTTSVSGGKYPCPWQRGWNEMLFEVLSSPNPSSICFNSIIQTFPVLVSRVWACESNSSEFCWLLQHLLVSWAVGWCLESSPLSESKQVMWYSISISLTLLPEQESHSPHLLPACKQFFLSEG